MAPKDLSKLLVSAGAISQPQANELVREGIVLPNAIATAVLAREWAEERAVCSALADVVGNPAVVLSESTLDLGALLYLPDCVALDHMLLPLEMDEDTIYVATANLDAAPVHQQLAAVAGRQVVLLRALEYELRLAIQAAYLARSEGADVLKGRLSTSEAPAIELVRPTPRAPASELTSLIRGLSRSLTLLRTAARVEVEGPVLEPMTSSVPVVPAPRAPTPETATYDAPVILVVEDDDGIRRLIAQALRHGGRNVVEAADGNAAFAILRTTKPALVVLDAMLPGIHGFEICTSIKKNPSYSDVPVIMVSAVFRGWQQAREIQEVHGADAFLEKPFSIAVLRAMVTDLLGQTVERTALSPDRAAEVAALRAQIDALNAQGQWDEAFVLVEQWIGLDAFDPAGHIERGSLQLQRADYEGAMRSYEMAVTFDRTIFASQANLAMVYEHLGFHRKSDEAWRRAATLAPDDSARERILERLEQQSKDAGRD